MFNIRLAKESDAETFGNIHVESWKAAYKDIIPDEYLSNMNPNKRAQRLLQGLSNQTESQYYVADNNNTIIGNLIIGKYDGDDNIGEVGAIYLLPDFWGKGYGKFMMDFALKELKNIGYNTIVLWVLEDNLRARRFYEKAGFVPSGEKKKINIGKSLIEIKYTYTVR